MQLPINFVHHQQFSLADILGCYTKQSWSSEPELLFLTGFLAGRLCSPDCATSNALCAVIEAWLKLQMDATTADVSADVDTAFDELENQMVTLPSLIKFGHVSSFPTYAAGRA